MPPDREICLACGRAARPGRLTCDRPACREAWLNAVLSRGLPVPTGLAADDTEDQPPTKGGMGRRLKSEG